MHRADPYTLAGRTFDLVVIGGGITGTATARDAALRGLSVLLIEKDDFASGTSSRLTKLIHGGLRYLETYQFKMVAESLRERETMLRLAPHLTQVRPFLYLLYRGYPETRFKLNLGLTFYDVASGHWRKRRHAMLNRDQVLRAEPHLNPEGLVGAGRFFDVLTDDARLTIDTAKSAAEAGAVLVNHAQVSGLVLERGRAVGVEITDRIGSRTIRVAARQVLNATGPWTEQTRSLEQPTHRQRLRPTKGVHIVVRKADFPLNTAVFLRSPDDNRVVWPIPAADESLVYVGTTDTDYAGDPDQVEPDDADIDYLLNVANFTIPDARLTRQHVVGSWAGLRPLVASEPGTSTGNTSREHAITLGPSGMLTISGGKLTSSRLMARQFVDAAVARLGRRRRRSRTGSIPISGGDRDRADGFLSRAKAAGAPEDLSTVWLARYGSNADEVLRRWTLSPRDRQVIGPRGLTRAEVRYCVEEEACLTLADLMVRRTSLFYWDPTGGVSHLAAIAAELAALLRWSDEERDLQADEYRAEVRRHRPGSKPRTT